MKLGRSRLYRRSLARYQEGVCSSIIKKAWQLTDEEYEIVKNHSLYSYYGEDIVRNILNTSVSMFIKYHHEHYDGKGYPEGLKGNEVPIESSILSVAIQ